MYNKLGKAAIRFAILYVRRRYRRPIRIGAGIVAVAPRDPVAASERLTAAGVTHSLREGAIRLSPHCYNTAEEIEVALEAL